MKTVFTNGVFDLLHVGHFRLLHFARNQGDWLFVAINSDSSAQRLKGQNRTIVPAEERREALFALSCVDDVQIFDEDTPEAVIARLRPDVLVKGPACKGTDIPGAALIESWGGKVIVPEWPIGHSTTQLMQHIGALNERLV